MSSGRWKVEMEESCGRRGGLVQEPNSFSAPFFLKLSFPGFFALIETSAAPVLNLMGLESSNNC